MEEQLINKEMLKTYFIMRLVVYDDRYEFLNEQSDEALLNWLNNLSVMIYDNKESHILSSQNKQTLYKILSICRDRFKDIDILNEVNEMISLLNTSSEENYVSMLINEFEDRVIKITPPKKLSKIKVINFEALEQLVLASFCYDYNFFYTLSSESENNFLEKCVNSAVALSNLSNLIIKYPNVLVDYELIDRAIKLLNYNIDSSKIVNSPFGSLQERSKECLKRLKSLK